MYQCLTIALCVFIFDISSVKSQSHAFIQVDNELRYLIDGVPIQMRESLEVGEREQRLDIYEEGVMRKFLVFEPPFLDYKKHAIGMPKMRKVFVQNTSPDTTIHLHSLSGNTMHFHCTFFQNKVLHPGQNTSFDVVYLGREEGFIENTIYVHTSVGTYRYWVKAVGMPNPYRVRPLIGLKMPLNSSYTPLIQVHNPHAEQLQILEMYSTGGDLHLELPEGVQEGLQDIWSIPPYQTKSLMRAAFVARRENNHTAYIRIVPGSPVDDFMVIPVEVEVSNEQGLFFPSDALYFGVLTPTDPPVSLPLYLLNSAHKHIHIQNIITSAVNEAILIDFKPIKIPPGTVHPTKVATITFDPSKATSGSKVAGKLIVKSKISAYKLSVPFYVDMHQGSITYNTKATKFYSGTGLAQMQPSTTDSTAASSHKASTDRTEISAIYTPHEIILKNSFKFSVVVYNLSLSNEGISHFKVKSHGPVIIKENEEAVVAKVKLLSHGSHLRFTVNLTVHTNVTTLNIPLVAFNGRLTKVVPTPTVDGYMDFGTLGMIEERSMYFYLLNENPVEIRLKNWGSTMVQSKVDLLSIQAGAMPNLDSLPNKTVSMKDVYLKPQEYAVFRISVLTPNTEGIFVAGAVVQTAYEDMKIPFRLRTADGYLSIFPNSLLLENSFPGKISSENIGILSTFSHSMTVERIAPILPDSRFAYIFPNNSLSQPILHPMVENLVGRIVFDPKVGCSDQCYSGFPLDTKDGVNYGNTFALPSNAAEVDYNLYKQMSMRFSSLDPISFDTSLHLDTSEVQGHRFNAKINMVWPRLVAKSVIDFSLTEVYNTSVREIVLENPASVPVAAQLIFFHNYPSISTITALLDEQVPEHEKVPWAFLTEEPFQECFHFTDSDQGNVCHGVHPNESAHANCVLPQPRNASLSEQLSEHRKRFETLLKTRSSKQSLVFVLEPLKKVRVRLSFMPAEEKIYSSLIMIRNNLTAIETILLKGSSGLGRIKLEKSKYNNYLPFELQGNAIKNYSSCNYYQNNSVFTIHKSLVVKNDGLLPVYVEEMKIGGVTCRNYGFHVVRCGRFTLRPSESKRIDVVFKPDFSLYQIVQRLSIQTSLGRFVAQSGSNLTVAGSTLSVKLAANIAPHIVLGCGGRVARPHWEPFVYCCVLTILTAMLLGTFVRAYLEAEHTLRTTFVPMTTVLPTNETTPSFDKAKVFDLKAAADEFRHLAAADCTPPPTTVFPPAAGVSPMQQQTQQPPTKKKPSPMSEKKLAKLYKTAIGASEKAEHKRNKNSSRTNHKDISLSLSSLLPAAYVSGGGGGSGGKPKKGHGDAAKKAAETKENYCEIGRRFGAGADLSACNGKRNNSESSSTTESSSMEECCPVKEETRIIVKKVKPKKKPLERHLSEGCSKEKADNILGESNFDLTSKHKKIKKDQVEPRKNNSIELPYTMKPVKIRDINDKNVLKNNIRMKPNKPLNVKSEKSSSHFYSHKFDPLKLSSLATDAPAKMPAKAVVAPRIQVPSQPLAPRDHSYSAVVLGNTKSNAKTTPIGKILPEIKHFEKQQPLDLGAIGQKPSQTNGKMHATPRCPSMGIIGQSSPSMHQHHHHQDTGPPAQYGMYSNTNSMHAVVSHPAYGGQTLKPTQPRQPQHGPSHLSLQQSPTSHSWDPRMLSSPSHLQALQGINGGLTYDTNATGRNNAMAEDDWLSFEGPTYQYSSWSEGDNCAAQKEKTPQAPPTPSLWESLSSFSIWSSPYDSSPLPLSSVYATPASRSLWQDDPNNPTNTGYRPDPSTNRSGGRFDSLSYYGRRESE